MAGGRPSVYDPDVHPTWAEALCIVEGLTTPQLAERFGVSTATVNRWIATHPEFRDALKMGKDAADAKVKKSLYELANGYRFTAKKTVREVTAAKGSKAEVVKVVETTTETFIPPHATAGIFWLKNRDPEHFRDNPEPKGEDAADSISEWVEASTPDAGELAALFDALDAGTVSE